mgnify:CR=1 FL=1
MIEFIIVIAKFLLDVLILLTVTSVTLISVLFITEFFLSIKASRMHKQRLLNENALNTPPQIFPKD